MGVHAGCALDNSEGCILSYMNVNGTSSIYGAQHGESFATALGVVQNLRRL